MELKQYLTPLKKWWWLIIAATLISATSAYISTQFEEPQYRTHATVMIGQTIEDPNPNGGTFYLTQQLAQSYADIALRQPVRQAVMAQLGLTWLPEYSVRIVANTQLLEISVIDTDAVRAQVVANTLAEQLIAQSPGSQQENQQRQGFINEQLDDLEIKIKENQDMIVELNTQLEDMVSARQIADTESQISVLQTKLTTLQSNYAELLANTQSGAVNSLRMVESAMLPEVAINANKMSTILLGAAIGFVLAAGAAYLMEYLDHTLKTPEEIRKTLGMPIISFVGQTATNDKDHYQPYVVNQPRSPVAESFRTLRTNLEFASVDDPLETILITSPNPSDGKSMVAANLAAIIANTGKRVVILDADLRRPRVQLYLNLPNNEGLSDIFLNQLSAREVMQKTTVDNLSAITSGDLPPNPSELLSSDKMQKILLDVKELADIVIIDSPPFVVSDSSILATKIDGVLLVMQLGSTNVDDAKAMKEQFDRAGARMVGIVLNRIPNKRGNYYNYYYAS
jgi:non-specific protein-tyrosine kinase